MLLATGSFLLWAVFLRGAGGANVLDWFWSEPAKESTVLITDGVPLISVPFESMTEDEKFLQAAAKFTDLRASSPLETCQHKVVARIKSSCGRMSEEELAKLSVNLLNCQSAVEGRKLFPCSDEMSLKQCTTDMDADTWNAYHLMSNRARAVCYALRNTQFRALTELTVDKLMRTAHSQIEALGSLEANQKRLEDRTLEALGSLSEENEALMKQQRHLRDAQVTAHNLVASNLRELNNEKALIRAGHAQLASLTEDIRTKLEKSSSELINQAMEQHENHAEILEDLSRIQDQARLIWEKIEAGTDRIVAQNAEAAARYERTLEKLVRINETIHFIWNLTESMRDEVDRKLGWITDYIGDTGEQFNRACGTLLHAIYLLGAMIVASFLQAPFATRAAIVGIVPVNLMTFLKHGAKASLDFTSITVLVLTITVVHGLTAGLRRAFGPREKSIDREDRHRRRSEPAVGNGHLRGSSTPETSSTGPGKNNRKAGVATIVGNTLGAIVEKLLNCRERIGALVGSAVRWCRRNATSVEELSCSYLPARKNREDLAMDHRWSYPSMSEDGTDFENSPEVAYDEDARSPLDDRRAYRPSESRSVTPNSGAPSRLCGAPTKSGSRCRSRATMGRQFCGRHATGSSMVGD